MSIMPLTRSHNSMIAGVCGGFAEWLGWSPTTVRILYFVVSIMSAAFPGILVYIVLWFIMPPPSNQRINEIRPGNFQQQS